MSLWPTADTLSWLGMLPRLVFAQQLRGGLGLIPTPPLQS